MTLVSKPFSALLEDFRSPSPTPGGGSASAIAGALGASLLAMVAGLPKPRTANADDERTLRDAGARSSGCARRLEALVVAESEEYRQGVAADLLPKGSDA